MKLQIAFRDRKDRMIAYKFEGGELTCSNGETISKSANEFIKRTDKGNNLKVVEVTKKNWKGTARAHADKMGFFKSVDTLEAESLDFDNLPQPEEPEAPYAFIGRAFGKKF